MFKQDHEHTPKAIELRLRKGTKITYLQEWVYGGIDGVITTFAIVAGVIGANLSPVIILILGIANLVGDGFSMAAGSYSSTKTEIDNYNRLRKFESKQIKLCPEGEKEEIRQIYKAKGFSSDELERIVETITSNDQLWIDTMMYEEYGLSSNQRIPIRSALNTFIAFLICGIMPLMPFLFFMTDPFYFALGFSAITFFAIGSFKSIWSLSKWWEQGINTMFIGLSAAGIAFTIGYWLRNLVL